MSNSHRRAARLRAGAALLGGLALTLALALRQRDNNRIFAREQFDAAAYTLANGVVARVQSYEYGLKGARGAIAAVGEAHMSRRAFRAYSTARDLSHEFPGALGLGFIRRIRAEDEATFVEAARLDGMPKFAIRQLEPHAGDRYVIQYIEPSERNAQAIGLDIASNQERRDAAVSALQTGRPTLTAPITLVQATGQPSHGLLLLVPIYRNGEAAPASQRPDDVVGWAYAPLLIEQILSGLGLDETGIALSIDDTTANAGRSFFSHSQGPTAVPRLCTDTTRSLFGRVWHFEMCAQQSFVQRLQLQPLWPVFAVGSIGSLLIAVLVGAYGFDRARKLQLHMQRMRLISIVENSSDAIVALDPNGVVTSWNNAAKRIFGYPSDAALGRPLQELIGSDPERFDVTPTLRGEELPHVDVTRRCADGSLVDVSIAASPITDASGQVSGVGLTIRDVRDRKRAQQQLAEWNTTLERQVAERTEQLDAARRHLQTVFDAIPSMIGYWDRELINRFANGAYSVWFGRDAATLPGKHMRELLGDAIFELNRAHVEAALRGEQQTFERTIPRPDGNGTRHSLAHYLPDIVAGEVRGFYAVVHDVTELTESRLRLAEALRNNEALLTTLDKLAIVSMTDRNGKIMNVNDAFCAISGYSRDELIGQTHRIINSKYHPQAFWADVWRTISSGTPWRGEVCNRAKDGSLYWVDTMLAPHADENGNIERYISIRIDITAAKRAAAALLHERERLDAIIRGTNVGTWEWNVQTGEMRLNERWANMIGYSLSELEPVSIETWKAHTDPEDWQRCEDALQAYLRGEQDSYECESRMITREGRSVWVLRRGRITTRTSMDAPDWLHGTQQDVTASHEAAEKLKRATHAAEAANAAKSAFLANMSHEIRTPLNAVIGLAYLLQQTKLDAEQRDRLGQLQLASRSLLDVINDVLDLSKIEAGEMAIELVDLDLRQLFDQLVLLMQPTAAEKGLELIVRYDDVLPRALQGDPIRLRQVLLNLLSNALKFTERGSVALEARCVELRDDSVLVECRVRDTGIGMAADVQERVFSPFTQADVSTTRRYGGTGLGLPIVRRLTELMGGTVTLHSAPAVGSEFTISLRLPRPSVSGASAAADATTIRVGFPAPADEEAHLPDVRVLVVDDSVINVEVARRILELEGACVFTAANGRDALDFLTGPQQVDLVMMDIQMPVMDGLEATRRLRGELKRTDLPVIALTASALVSERQRALDAGMTGFATKPFDPKELIRTIRGHLEKARGYRLASRLRSASASQRPPSPAPQIEGFDLSELHATLEPADVKNLVRLLFVEFADVADGAIPDLVDPQTRAQWAGHLHKLRGSASVVGANEIYRLAGQAELALRTESSIKLLLLRCREVSAALAKLREHAQAFLTADLTHAGASSAAARK